jgi:hypothetical protein
MAHYWFFSSRSTAAPSAQRQQLAVGTAPAHQHPADRLTNRPMPKA